MIDKLKQSWPAQQATDLAAWAQGWLIPALLRRRVLGIAVVASLAAAIYWSLIASDRYVSEAHAVIQATESSPSTNLDIGGLLGNSTFPNRADQLMLRDHLLSIDMLEKLDKKLNLRAHYSSWWRDPLSQMWFENASIERFHNYFLTRVSVELDEYSGVLIIRAQGFDAETAHSITQMLVDEGERHMNELAHRLARDQVAFLEKQVAEMNNHMLAARSALLTYQNEKGLASPTAKADTIATITSRLEAQLSDLKTRRGALLTYLSADAPDVAQLNSQITALEAQIAAEQERVAQLNSQITALEAQIAAEQERVASSKGGALNSVVEEYQRLEMAAKFAQDLYQTALTALEKGRVESLRNLKKVSILQTATMPQYPLEPRRFYNIIVFVLCAMILSGIIHLVAAVIRDHKD